MKILKHVILALLIFWYIFLALCSQWEKTHWCMCFDHVLHMKMLKFIIWHGKDIVYIFYETYEIKRYVLYAMNFKVIDY